MQIHEVTIPPAVSGAAQRAVQGVKNVVTAPIKAAQAAGAAVGGLAGKAVGAVQQGAGTLASPLEKMKSAYGQAKIGARATGIAGKAQTSWETYVKNLEATQQATPDVLETALRAFIQKNLLGDLKYQYNTLTNVGQIEAVIKQVINPANVDKQSELWNQLVRTIAVSQAGGQAPGTGVGVGAGGGKRSKGGGGVAPGPTEIATAVQAAGISPAIYKNMGTVLKSAGASAASTGNPVVDAFLRSLGFNVQ